MIIKNIHYLASLITFLLFISCSSTQTPEPKSSQIIFDEAMQLFNDEDYLEAKKLFEIILLQYPASQFADDAQFYIAEINYKNGEFILAAFNYNRLRSAYPSSSFVKECLFKSALSYYELSPDYDRDQEYTLKAINEFNAFQRLYPDDTLFHQASIYIDELRNRLALREFFTANLYRKWGDLKAALIYFDVVINEYPDTQYFEMSYLNKIEILVELKRFDDASGLINLYKNLFRHPKFRNEIELLESKVQLSKLEN